MTSPKEEWPEIVGDTEAGADPSVETKHPKLVRAMSYVPNALLLYPTYHEDAIVGVSIDDPPRVILSKQAMVERYVKDVDLEELDDDQTPEEVAIEWFEYNTWNTYVSDDDGRNVSPIYIDDLGGI